ncbi:hypothetical protein Droror1_Dr00021547 [Drosera rotundifolia]
MRGKSDDPDLFMTRFWEAWKAQAWDHQGKGEVSFSGSSVYVGPQDAGGRVYEPSQTRIYLIDENLGNVAVCGKQLVRWLQLVVLCDCSWSSVRGQQKIGSSSSSSFPLGMDGSYLELFRILLQEKLDVLSNLLYFYGMCSVLKEMLLKRYFSQEIHDISHVPEFDIVRSTRNLLDEKQSLNVMRFIGALNR